MYWYLFFVLLILIVTLPLKTKIVIKGNVLNLSSQLYVSLFKIKLLKLKVKLKNGFVYITKGKYTYKEKLSASNINVIFVINLAKLLYFRLQLIELIEETEIGYKNNAMTTCMAVAGVDIVSKGILSRVKNNKKFSHIFIENRAKYDDDCLNFKLQATIKINLLDIIYCFIASKIKSKGVKYETTKQREQSEVAD